MIQKVTRTAGIPQMPFIDRIVNRFPAVLELNERALNEFVMKTLAADGYASAEMRVTPILTEIIIRATHARYCV